MTGKHAYLLIVDKNPKQIRILLESIDNIRNDIFIHIDAKSSVLPSDIKYDDLKSKIFVFKEIKVYWSDISLTEVELFLLQKAKQKGSYCYYHLLSGSDMPLKPQSEILDFFDKNQGKEFVEYQVPGKYLKKPYYSRVKFYHLFTKHYRHTGKFRLVKDYFFVAIEYTALFFQMLVGVNRIKNFEFAKGSQWFDITDELAEYVLSKSDWIRKQFNMTRASDESFLPILVQNSNFKDRLYNQKLNNDMHGNMRFIDWTRGEPYVFRISDLSELLNSDLLFARKFDEKVDFVIIEKIREYVCTE